MGAWIRRAVLAGFFLPSLVLAQTPVVAGATTPAEATPVTVQAGEAFHVALDNKVRISTWARPYGPSYRSRCSPLTIT